MYQQNILKVSKVDLVAGIFDFRIVYIILYKWIVNIDSLMKVSI